MKFHCILESRKYEIKVQYERKKEEYDGHQGVVRDWNYGMTEEKKCTTSSRSLGSYFSMNQGMACSQPLLILESAEELLCFDLMV